MTHENRQAIASAAFPGGSRHEVEGGKVVVEGGRVVAEVVVVVGGEVGVGVEGSGSRVGDRVVVKIEDLVVGDGRGRDAAAGSGRSSVEGGKVVVVVGVDGVGGQSPWAGLGHGAPFQTLFCRRW